MLPAEHQTVGDCQVSVCNGNHSSRSHNIPDDDDDIDDGNECTTDTCQSGTLFHAPKPAGTPCNGGDETATPTGTACPRHSFVGASAPSEVMTVDGTTA